ncbi:hypothetical protein HK102_006847 [Quaeritorhiza haematococci]|nr:hypothetical protein HK102_006847 [Quaeritorhiza haematococci]
MANPRLILNGAKPFGGFVPPRIAGRWATKLGMSTVWFFLMYRFYVDGPHHFLHHHAWEEPEMIHYLEQVDKKWGTNLATANMHHHGSNHH